MSEQTSLEDLCKCVGPESERCPHLKFCRHINDVEQTLAAASECCKGFTGWLEQYTEDE